MVPQSGPEESSRDSRTERRSRDWLHALFFVLISTLEQCIAAYRGKILIVSMSQDFFVAKFYFFTKSAKLLGHSPSKANDNSHRYQLKRVVFSLISV